jgi:hypothetical protein
LVTVLVLVGKGEDSKSIFDVGAVGGWRTVRSFTHSNEALDAIGGSNNEVLRSNYFCHHHHHHHYHHHRCHCQILKNVQLCAAMVGDAEWSGVGHCIAPDVRAAGRAARRMALYEVGPARLRHTQVKLDGFAASKEVKAMGWSEEQVRRPVLASIPCIPQPPIA